MSVVPLEFSLVLYYILFVIYSLSSKTLHSGGHNPLLIKSQLNDNVHYLCCGAS